MDATVPAATESTPEAAAPTIGKKHLRLFIKHEWVRVKIGSGLYAFRTLSLSDVIEVQPHLDRLVPAMLGSPDSEGFDALAAAEGVAVIKVVCPQLLDSVDDVKAIDTAVINEVIAFYKKQDWDKVSLVRALRSSNKGMDEELDNGLTDRDTFFGIAAMCADRSRETVPQFLDQRIEYCMDAILALHAEYKRKSTEGKIPHADFANVMSSLMGNKKYDQDTAPAWMVELNERAQAEDEKS